MKSLVYVNINSLIKEKWITFKELSEMSWISAQQLSAINKKKPTRIAFSTIYKLLLSLNCAPNDLFLISNYHE